MPRHWILLLTVFLLAPTAMLAAQIPNPKVTGPIPITAMPGDKSHNYPFGATQANLTEYGYREDEFYIEGSTNAYVNQGAATGAIRPGGPYPYKTRVIVRRPKASGKFNGTVILEWIVSSAGFDQENDWIWSHEHLMRAGYAYIGVTARPQGIEGPSGLKVWNPARYGSLRVSTETYPGGALSFDVYSQVAQAAKHPVGMKLLGDLVPRNIIATGHSVAGGSLITYYNMVHSLAGVIDGFVFHGVGGEVRTDLKTPAWKLLSEAEVRSPAAVSQPDSDFLRTWEVAGAAHAGWDLLHQLEPLLTRDLGPLPDDMCDEPPMSRIPSYLVQNALYDWMKLWIEKGTQPPRAPRIALLSSGRGGRGGTPGVVARDENGNALGGIRLAQFAVPIATDKAGNSGTQFCSIMGSHVPFDNSKLAHLYPTHKAYVATVKKITDENLKAGYITREGATQTNGEAARSKIGGDIQ